MQMERASLTVRVGPPLPRLELVKGTPAHLGRSSDCTYRMNDPAVSRRHACIEHVDGRWTIVDTESRHGTTVGSERLTPGVRRTLQDGDLVTIGPWQLQFSAGSTQRSTVLSVDDRRQSAGAVQRLDRGALGTLAERRLDALIRVAAALHTASEENEAAMIVAEALLGGTGFERAAVVRPVMGVEQLEVLAALDRGRVIERPRVSRSLLGAALEGQIVQKQDMPAIEEAVSIVGVSEALCAPVRVDGRIDALLYLDSDMAGERIYPDAAVFAAAAADLCGFALSALAAQRARVEQEKLLQDLRLARDVQERLMPRSTGELNGLTYGMSSVPGRHLAGDLFGLIDLGEGRSALLLGDVAGKGAAAGMLMATVQSQIEALLEHGASLVEAVDRASRTLMRRAAPYEFVTLWIGILDMGAGTLEYVDAGHGYAFLLSADAAPRRLDGAGGVPIGVTAPMPYRSDTLTLPAGSRIVLVSDGVIEQVGPANQQFGAEGLLRTIAQRSTPQAEVADVVTALRVHAGGMEFADDVTIVSVHVGNPS